MVENMLVNGNKVSNTVRVNIIFLVNQKELDNGYKEKEFVG
jgi:hypothetical protein